MDFIDERAIPAFIESTQLVVELESVDVYNTIIFPTQAKDYKFNPQIEVPYDIKQESTTQRRVD